ncbi:hypothetical protein NQ317_017422 [Molorchus minor]|uniref:Dynactin subunit 5 n=1 Tax=Molorchus minor TaxID=1323400 RepID=A0ABQ9ITW7_9CUCU|nr:hypothetical protein NQ317_017422 [Molorchus minor]
MELRDINYNKGDYVETASGNKVCRQTVLCGSQNIILQGKVIVQSEAIIRGDLANGCLLFPLLWAIMFMLGERSVVNAAIVGNYVYIGKNCVIGRRCTLKDCCVIEDNTI